MKLSDAILKGSRLKPKTNGNMFNCDENGKLFSCALGAAYDAIKPFKWRALKAEKLDGMTESKRYVKAETKMFKTLCKTFPQLKKKSPFDLPNGEVEKNLAITISTLNDEYEWSREKIAKFIAKKGF